MKLRASYFRSTMSLVLTLAIVTVFTLHSFAAAPEVSKSVGESIPPQDCTGILTVKAGRVTINGNAAQTGATVMTGSVINTSSNGNAIVDLGAVGRVEIGDNTTVTLTCVATLLEIKTNCSRTEVEVRRGTLDVKSPKTEQLFAGKKTHYDGDFDATSTGGVDVKVECEGRKAAGLWIGPGLLGLLALIGLGAAVAVGIGSGSESNPPPPSSGPPSSPIR
jgi:hypothetical protein